MQIVGVYTGLANGESLFQVPQLFGYEGSSKQLYSFRYGSITSTSKGYHRYKENEVPLNTQMFGLDSIRPNTQQPFTMDLWTDLVYLFGTRALELLEKTEYIFPGSFMDEIPFIYGTDSYRLVVVKKDSVFANSLLPSYETLAHAVSRMESA